MNTYKTSLLVLISLCLLLPAQRAAAATEVAKINNTSITLEEFNKKYQENLKFFQFKAPSRKSVLDDLIKRELGIQEARKLGLDKDPDVIERMNTVLYQSLLEKKLNKEFEAIHISDDDAKQYYSKYPEIRTSHIFVAVRSDAKAEDEAAAKAKIQKINNDYLKPGKMTFAEVAQRYSEGVAAPMGGDFDYQTKDKLGAAVYDAALKLKTPGKVSEIVRSPFGYHIIKLTAIRPWDDVDKGAVKRLVFEEKRGQIFERYMNQLRQQAKVSVHSELLKD